MYEYDAAGYPAPYRSGYPVVCYSCDYEDEAGREGITCPHCEDDTLEVMEPAEPCICPGDHCYC